MDLLLRISSCYCPLQTAPKKPNYPPGYYPPGGSMVFLLQSEMESNVTPILHIISTFLSLFYFTSSSGKQPRWYK